MLDVLLRYEGALADEHELDFYDAARALVGFQRSLALTAHLVLNGEIITQAPSLKNARILVTNPRAGSWELVATIIGGAWVAGTVTKDSPLGHLLYSVYDYVVAQTLGFPVDYNKSLYQKYREVLAEKEITPARLDSLTEKIEGSLSDIHRPIVASKTASRADIYAGRAPKIRLGREFSPLTYDYLKQFEVDDEETETEGIVSSYNINTHKGRLFVFEEERPIAFQLNEDARSRRHLNLITSSLRSNAIERGDRDGAICLTGRRVTSSNGRLKGLWVSGVSKSD